MLDDLPYDYQSSFSSSLGPVSNSNISITTNETPSPEDSSEQGDNLCSDVIDSAINQSPKTRLSLLLKEK